MLGAESPLETALNDVAEIELLDADIRRRRAAVHAAKAAFDTAWAGAWQFSAENDPAAGAAEKFEVLASARDAIEELRPLVAVESQKWHGITIGKKSAHLDNTLFDVVESFRELNRVLDSRVTQSRYRAADAVRRKWIAVSKVLAERIGDDVLLTLAALLEANRRAGKTQQQLDEPYASRAAEVLDAEFGRGRLEKAVQS